MSCFACPSRLNAEEAAVFFKKGTGAPMCARFGHVLGKPGLKPSGERLISESFAKNCNAFGKARPVTPVELRLGVAIGDPAILTAGMPDDNERARVPSCAGCKNFIREETVMKEMGWAGGMCAMSGRLLLTNRLTHEATNCDWRSPGAARMSTFGITLKPVYADAFDAAEASVAKRVLKSIAEEVVDPTVYPTDKAVTPEEEKAGVRAWRKVEDMNSDRHVFLPIYRADFFDPMEQEKIPTAGSDEHPELYVDHLNLTYKVSVLWTELDETPALWGMAGTGKTEFMRYMAWLMQLPFERMSITAESEIDDIAGKMLYDPEKGTYFHYGRLPRAWGKPCVLCLDEPNTGPDEVWQFIRPLTDNSKQLVLDQNEGEKVTRHADCYLGMAMNPAWDPRNQGANSISDADGNRLMHIFLDLPPAAIEREIIKARCKLDGYEVPSGILDKVQKVAEDIRQLSDDGTIPISWGVRPNIKVTRATKWFSLMDAYRLAVADYLEPEAQEAVLSIVRGYEEG